MKKKLFFFLIVFFSAVILSACHNKYEVTTYQTTDSYRTVFEGKYVPQDVR